MFLIFRQSEPEVFASVKMLCTENLTKKSLSVRKVWPFLHLEQNYLALETSCIGYVSLMGASQVLASLLQYVCFHLTQRIITCLGR